MRTAFTLDDALGRSGGLTKSAGPAPITPGNPLAVMKAVHATGGTSIVRAGVDSPSRRFNDALASTLEKSGSSSLSARFRSALETARRKMIR